MMYFIVRTDVDASSGMQRVFGVFDTEPEAVKFRDDLAAHMRGEFAVYLGRPVAQADQ